MSALPSVQLFRSLTSLNLQRPLAGRPADVNIAAYANPALLDEILTQLRKELGPHVTVTVGSYGYNAESARIAEKHGAQYLPVFTALDRDEAITKGRGNRAPASADPDYAGEVPKLATLSGHQKKRWGIEMGQRIRDQLRDRNPPAQGWQLDEIYKAIADLKGKNGELDPDKVKRSLALLDYFSGLFQGMLKGRPGDKPMQGVVHMANPGHVLNALVTLAKNDHAGQVKQFLQSMNAAVGSLVLEMYPTFRGKSVAGATAAGAADARDRLERILGALGELQKIPGLEDTVKELKQKLTPGLTPGHGNPGKLGGVVGSGMSRAEESAYRKSFTETALELLKAAGVKKPTVSEYNFVKRRDENGNVVDDGSTSDRVLHDVFSDLEDAWEDADVRKRWGS